MKVCEINPYIRFANSNHTFLYPKHVCARDHRLFYLQEGSARVLVEGRAYSISPGTLMLWKSGTNYCFETEQQLRLIVINFDYTQIRSDQVASMSVLPADAFTDDMVLESVFFEDAELFNAPLVLDNMQRFEAPLLQVASDYITKMVYFGEYTSSILKQTLIDLLRCSLTRNMRSTKAIQSIIQYIHNHYASEINNKVIAKEFSYHEYHINKLMVKHTGVTLHQYLINYRIFVAKQMLINTELPLTEIAEKTGFEGGAYFSNCFKKVTGLAPSEFRSRHQNLV